MRNSGSCSTLSDPTVIDEEEMRDLSARQLESASTAASASTGSARKPRLQQPKEPSASCARGGVLELYLPLALLVILGIAVIAYNLTRFREEDACDPNAPRAKHFYCYNHSALPGVHTDSH